MAALSARPRCLFDFPAGSEQRRLLAFGEPRRVELAVDLREVRALLQKAELASRSGQWVACFVAYEASPAFDRAHCVTPPAGLPLAWYATFDAPLERCAIPAGDRFDVTDWQPSVDAERFEADIARVKESIARGDVYQVNYTFRLHANMAGEDLAWFMHLRAAQPDGYCAYVDLGRYRLLSASPELFFRRDGNVLTTRPMKGTARRSADPTEDAALADWLHRSVKNRAENAMIVDVLRNDLSRIALTGSVHTPALFTIERYPTVLQMTSTVTARIADSTSLDEIFAALFPCGSITGAPKISATNVIARLEQVPRGSYCGSIGLLLPNGDAIFNVAIRTVMVDRQTGTATCGVGGGITWDSTWRDEYEEALLKSAFLRGAPGALAHAGAAERASASPRVNPDESLRPEPAESLDQ